MSSANPKVHEPSMEEILASIRRIISDDQDTFADPRPSVDLYAVPQEEAQPQDYTPSIVVSDDVSPNLATETEEQGEAAGSEDAQASASAEPAAWGASPPVAAKASAGLLSDAVSASIASAFGRLEPRAPSAAPQSLEDTVRDMLRPMLKAWLDQNLPGIVERLVQAEIERVTRA
jgi:cell pole-organizing protein PopZ